jgi:predicted transcriptional regulator of viral defense system
MKFEKLLAVVQNEPLFETGILLAGNVDPNDVRRQLSRWVSAGRICQIRRGLYSLAPPYQKVAPHPFLIANALMPGSYVSKQSALAFHGFIPEYVPKITSITTIRPAVWDEVFHFHRIAASLFFGYQAVELPQGQHAFVATPEKALLDLAHFTTGSDSPKYLRELRLQNLENLDISRLNDFARRAQKPKWHRVAKKIAIFLNDESESYKNLP